MRAQPAIIPKASWLAFALGMCLEAYFVAAPKGVRRRYMTALLWVLKLHADMVDRKVVQLAGGDPDETAKERELAVAWLTWRLDMIRDTLMQRER
jgi:hypothetical protein